MFFTTTLSGGSWDCQTLLRKSHRFICLAVIRIANIELSERMRSPLASRRAYFSSQLCTSCTSSSASKPAAERNFKREST